MHKNFLGAEGFPLATGGLFWGAEGFFEVLRIFEELKVFSITLKKF